MTVCLALTVLLLTENSINRSVSDLQARMTSSVSYVVPSASTQIGAGPNLPCLPHIVIQPPNLKSVCNATVDQNFECMMTQVSCFSASAASELFMHRASIACHGLCVMCPPPLL